MKEKINLPEGLLNEETYLTLKDFCIICGIDEPYVIEMVEMGILEPKGQSITTWQFSVLHINRFRRAKRLQNDLKLNLAGAALGLELLDEVRELRDYIKKLEHQLKLLTEI